MMTYACTSIPLACASLIKSCSGSKPAAIITKSGPGSRELRYQESPRRRTCAKIAFALAARALFTTATTSAWLLSVVLKVSTQKARYWLTVWAAAPTEANDIPIKSQAPRQVARNGWPPGAKLRFVRFSMVFLRKPWGHHEWELCGLWDSIGSYKSYTSYKSHSGFSGVVMPRGKVLFSETTIRAAGSVK